MGPENGNPDYQAGLRDGRISALETIVTKHEERFDHHEQRLRIMERILYILIGAIALIQILPAIRGFIGGVP